MAPRQLKVIRLIEPDLCRECRFAERASVKLSDGRIQLMLHCRRMDCDNWDYEDAEDACSMRVESDAA
jgi:hypothetical protein